MVKFALQLCARFENVKSLAICGDDFRWYFKIRCGNCNWETESSVFVTLADRVELRRANVNLAMKCRMCSREITVELPRASVKPYISTEEAFQTVAEFDCRGGEPFDFDSSGWVVVSDSDQTFQDVDLTSKEWCDYDEELRSSVGIYDFRKFIIYIKNSDLISMRLYEKPFGNGFVNGLYLIGNGLTYPQFWIINKCLSYWRETTAEREWRAQEGPCYERNCIIILSFVFGLIAVVIWLPFTIIGYFLWLTALRYRNPFVYSSNCNESKVGDTGGPLLLAGRNIAILSLNCKLLPEFQSRTYNLGHVCRRARQIAAVIIHATTGNSQLKDPSSAGKNSFALVSGGGGGGPHGDSISQVSYGFLDKSAAYGDNISENRSLVSGTAVDVIVSGVNGLQSVGGTFSAPVPNGDSYSVGAGTTSGGATLAPDQMTVASLRSVEGMWQRRAAHQEKTESCVTLKSDVPIKQLAVSGLPGSSHTLESLNSESRSRASEQNPSTMSVSSRMHGIPSLAAPNNVHHNGSAIVSVPNGSADQQQQRQSGPPSRPLSQQLSGNQQVPAPSLEVQENPQPSEQQPANLLAAPNPSSHSNQSSAVDAPPPAPVPVVDLPSVGGAAASVGFSSVVCMPTDCPPTDIVCLQEVSDSRANQIVSSRLLTVYPHVIHSAKRYHGFNSNPFTVGNLVIASKFPILCARYHEQLTTFGKRALLVAKLLLQHVGEQRIVAIVGNVFVERNSSLTMLEPGDFDEVVKWLRSFRNDAISSDVNDVLSLDVCAGYVDLPEDGALVNEILQHEFFLSYISPTIHTGDALFGAELRPSVMYESEVNQPESLHHTLFRFHPTGPHLSELFRRLSDVAGETAPFALMHSSFLRYCRETPDTEQPQRQQRHRSLQYQSSSSRGGVTTAFAGLTPHLGLNASFQQS